MYKPPSDNVCTSCKGWKPKDKYCCGKKECLEHFRSFSKGKGYIMTLYKAGSGIPVHTLSAKVNFYGRYV